MNKTSQVLLAFVPLLLTPVLMLALGEGYLDFGGGEKDVLWGFVWGIWALVFAVCAIVLILRGWGVGRWLRRSFSVSLGVMFGLWLIAFTVSVLARA